MEHAVSLLKVQTNSADHACAQQMINYDCFYDNLHDNRQAYIQKETYSSINGSRHGQILFIATLTDC